MVNRTLALAVLCSIASLARAAGPADLKALTEGAVVHEFTARNLYLDSRGEPKGARFVYKNGLPVDVLFFASEPQFSVYAKTLTFDNRGEPHTGEHLLIGKGRIGKYLNSLIEMRLADHTAATYDDLTNYSFHTAAGPGGFFELTEKYLQALLHPEFTDEEIRREVANLGVDKGDDGALHLDEKGTVYQEMVSTMEKPDSRNWNQLKAMVFGAGHPLAMEAGGLPADIRTLTPEDIRAFHDKNYVLGPNMRVIAALPLAWSFDDALAKLGGIFGRLQPESPARAYAELPDPAPSAEPELRIGTFPSDDPNVPQTAQFGWKPLAHPTNEQITRLQIFLSLVAGGDTSLLYADVVDGKTRVYDSGATSVSQNLDVPPMDFPVISVGGLPAARVTRENLAKLRDVITARLRRVAGLKPGDPELREAGRKAKSLISSARRGMLKFMDDPPHFGDRNAGINWHRQLDQLASEPGFAKDLSLEGEFDRLEKDIDGPGNPWEAIARGGGLLDEPYVSAVVPNAEELKRDKEEKSARLAGALSSLEARYGEKNPQAALARFQADADAQTRKLAERDAGIEKPGFVKDPPLTLDDVEYARRPAPGGRGEIETYFGATPFTDMTLAFDMNGVKPGDLELLPLLGSVISDVGVTAKDGETLDYVKAVERWRSEIYSFGAGTSADPRSGRFELVIHAAASSPEEVGRGVDWMESFLLRRATGAATRQRLVDLLNQGIQGGRDIFQQPEEAWVNAPAAAYRWQDRPIYMAESSPFTVLHEEERLRWRLDGPSPERRAELDRVLAAAKKALDLASAKDAASALPEGNELAEYFRFELAHAPAGHWREDLRRLFAETAADLKAPPEETLARLDGLVRTLLTRATARVHVTGSRENAARAREKLATLLTELPEGRPAPAFSPGKPLVLARLAERVPSLAGAKKPPVHVGLVDNGTKTGVHIESAAGPDYREPTRDNALDFLAASLFSGAGPESFFMQTWSAGLAYSNGVHARLPSGRVSYYAERCPDLSRTMRFVVGLASSTKTDSPELLRMALAQGFDDFRGSDDFASRGEALVDDILDGMGPDVVRRFKTKLLEVAAEPAVAAEVSRRARGALSRVLVGLGKPMSEAPGAIGFVIGPDELLDGWERALEVNGEAKELVRLYPRDFWP